MPASLIPVHKVFSWYSKGIINRIKIVWQAFRNQGDVNHITGDVHFAAILLNKKKTILTVHDCGMLAASTGLKHRLLKYFWFTLPLKRCTIVTVVSEATKSAMLKYVSYPEKNIRVVPVAVSEKFTYSPHTFNAERPVILQVGTTPNKNLPRLIEAIKDIPCQLRIIGRLNDEIKQQLEQAGVDYVNLYDLTQEELIEEYIQCDMLSFASTYEGFGMPVIEANLVGRPVITSNVHSMPEVAGKAACLVDPFNVASIRRGIMQIIKDEAYRKQLIQYGIENARRFDAQVIADSYISLYEQIIRNNNVSV
ncbi:MAG: glycosyltransferase family 1 protein [Chitinophagaceae bacterium]